MCRWEKNIGMDLKKIRGIEFIRLAILERPCECDIEPPRSISYGFSKLDNVIIIIIIIILYSIIRLL